MSAISDELKYHMERQRISARELARQSDVKSSFIYDVLSGKSNNPSTVKLAKVARVLGINLSQLVEPNHVQAVPDISIVSSNAYDDLFTPTLLNPAQADTDMLEPFAFSQRWLKQLCPQAHNLNQVASLIITGDAMSPSLLAGDYVLVDQSATQPFPPGFFVIKQDSMYDVRRLEYVYGTDSKRIRVIADHDHYSQYETRLDTLSIIGRIIWHARSVS
ncbi:MAG: helix-turn-helix domain-containing protein [Rickettsiales bacterium]|nr:helix-turn-helix domain-containing protein [Rickettsiales bacterium]